MGNGETSGCLSESAFALETDEKYALENLLEQAGNYVKILVMWLYFSLSEKAEILSWPGI